MTRHGLGNALPTISLSIRSLASDACHGTQRGRCWDGYVRETKLCRKKRSQEERKKERKPRLISFPNSSKRGFGFSCANATRHTDTGSSGDSLLCFRYEVALVLH
eukprot:scaffold149_cov315-Pinguiococcus_pyrenoidosus.AAC.161